MKLEILKCLLCNVGQAIMLVILTWTKTVRKGTVSKQCYKEHNDDFLQHNIRKYSYTDSHLPVCCA